MWMQITMVSVITMYLVKAEARDAVMDAEGASVEDAEGKMI